MEYSHPAQTASKRTRIAVTVGSILVGLAFLGSGITKVTGDPAMVANFAAWGYPAWALYVVGAVEVIAAAFLVIPRTTFLAGGTLAGLMVGAVGTHVVAAEWTMILAPVVLGSLAVLIAWQRRPDQFRERPSIPATGI